MKGILYLVEAVVLFGLVWLLVWWLMKPIYVEGRECEVASKEVKAAMYKMGPYYEYRLHPDGKLEVKLKGKWRNLNY